MYTYYPIKLQITTDRYTYYPIKLQTTTDRYTYFTIHTYWSYLCQGLNGKFV